MKKIKDYCKSVYARFGWLLWLATGRAIGYTENMGLELLPQIILIIALILGSWVFYSMIVVIMDVCAHVVSMARAGLKNRQK